METNQNQSNLEDVIFNQKDGKQQKPPLIVRWLIKIESVNGMVSRGVEVTAKLGTILTRLIWSLVKVIFLILLSAVGFYLISHIIIWVERNW